MVPNLDGISSFSSNAYIMNCFTDGLLWFWTDLKGMSSEIIPLYIIVKIGIIATPLIYLSWNVLPNCAVFTWILSLNLFSKVLSARVSKTSTKGSLW